jgi:hypothetical protein
MGAFKDQKLHVYICPSITRSSLCFLLQPLQNPIPRIIPRTIPRAVAKTWRITPTSFDLRYSEAIMKVGREPAKYGELPFDRFILVSLI